MPDSPPTERQRLDRRLSRLLLLCAAVVAAFILWDVGLALWAWVATWPAFGAAWWSSFLAWLADYAGVVAAVYTMTCINAAGLAELKHGRRFLVALGLALVLTPPVMMAAYGSSESRTE